MKGDIRISWTGSFSIVKMLVFHYIFNKDSKAVYQEVEIFLKMLQEQSDFSIGYIKYKTNVQQ